MWLLPRIHPPATAAGDMKTGPPRIPLRGGPFVVLRTLADQPYTGTGRSVRKELRARFRRLFTVPTGMPISSAISS